MSNMSGPHSVHSVIMQPAPHIAMSNPFNPFSPFMMPAYIPP
jgi:hypothetical protein